MAAMDGGDWRARLPPNSRQEMANILAESVTSHLRSDPNGLELEEIRRTAARVEKKVYDTAESENQYRQLISMEILAMATMALGSTPISGGNSFNGPPYDEY